MNPTMHGLRYLSSAPRAHLFTCAYTSLRRLSISVPRRNDSGRSPSPFGFGGGPSPPRLPKEEQEIFESLQRASTGAFSTPRTPARIHQSPDSSTSRVNDAELAIEARVEEVQSGGGENMTPVSEEQSPLKGEYDRMIEARAQGEELHPNVARGARPEFEGDINPKTGEIGGPKNEPLRWGAEGEWSYNGRTTDF
ncbi:uncharacterized protein Z518_04376 [Rhinocladiella mackenziei CBS 650.93]|uniref:Succinate dehydrogenase assembly factor 4, mitochondrial n=1 Tax=Rhinocladiella mackenziei CBS 650.93 TaxID=1442369 RepID=A0A0D2JBB3_9EURO|nr:uncharacterized protein Z518_04376 [Rhinocladiella mackenziei CBS 650.93]KIX06400.1 hypothetical protein Z518_04376 [Rhinocladiella mackenziei CBS 650.93]